MSFNNNLSKYEISKCEKKNYFIETKQDYFYEGLLWESSEIIGINIWNFVSSLLLFFS